MFHGGDESRLRMDRPIWLASREVALDYARHAARGFGASGQAWLTEVEVDVDPTQLADGEDLQQAADEIGLVEGQHWWHLWELAETPGIQDRLRAAGHAGATYLDQDHDGRSHAAVMILDTARLRVVASTAMRWDDELEDLVDVDDAQAHA
jgi:hypothetical protein